MARMSRSASAVGRSVMIVLQDDFYYHPNHYHYGHLIMFTFIFSDLFEVSNGLSTWEKAEKSFWLYCCSTYVSNLLCNVIIRLLRPIKYIASDFYLLHFKDTCWTLECSQSQVIHRNQYHVTSNGKQEWPVDFNSGITASCSSIPWQCTCISFRGVAFTMKTSY